MLTAETGDEGIARVVGIEDRGNGQFAIRVEGVAEGTTALHVIADDGGNRPVELMPVPSVQVVEPQLTADVDGNGIVNQGDLVAFVRLFVAGDPAADANGDGIVGSGDVAAFVELFLEAVGRGRGRYK